MDSKSLIGGTFFILLGVLFLGDNFGWIEFSMATFWPWLVVLVGVFFLLGWFRNRSETGLLMAGTIFSVYGLLFLYCSNYGWWQMGAYNLWAFFIIGPGLGFLMLYLFGEQEGSLLYTAVFLIGLGTLFLMSFLNFGYFLPLLMIAIGLWMIIKNRRAADNASQTPTTDAGRES
ncbi:MAG TPA: DUF5668 domain-containing protein [Calditrichia bacterium]|nr:hypothetical protein [Calditrichota bacterium]HQV33841.1 DUF5668 domain-containing protein [Calditrichia bacterium]